LGFASLLSEIAIGAAGALPVPVPVPARVPLFVSRMIEDVRLKENRFRIVSGANAEEVSVFASRVESAEQSGHWE
jgi:hypothetical protein